MSVGARCTICTGQFTRNDVGALRCGHTFHVECVEQWLKASTSCPICRKYTTVHDIIGRLFFACDDDGDNTLQIAFIKEKMEKLHFELKVKKVELEKLKSMRKLRILQIVSLEKKKERLSQEIHQMQAEVGRYNEQKREGFVRTVGSQAQKYKKICGKKSRTISNWLSDWIRNHH